MVKPRYAFLVVSLIAASRLLVGCGGGGGGGSTGQIELSLVDAPLDADAIYVDITSVEVHSEESGWVTLTQYSPALHVNLLDYRTDGEQLMLADCPLATGNYTMVRLMISAAQVVVGGDTYDVDITNVEQTGVKCNHPFTVAPGQLVALILDFNAGRSFVNTGSGDYKLHPVMTMSPVNLAAMVTGKVVFTLAAGGTPDPAPTDVLVNLYQPGHAGEADYLVAGAVPAEDGAFTMDVVAQGTYDLEVAYTYNSTSATSVTTGVNVVTPTTDLGEIGVVIP